MTFKIQFIDTDTMLSGERCSKKLQPSSDLVQHLEKIRKEIKVAYPTAKAGDRPWYIELHRGTRKDRMATKQELPTLERSRKLQGSIVGPTSWDSYKFIDERALALKTPPVDGYGDTHIIIAYFPETVTGEQKDD